MEDTIYLTKEGFKELEGRLLFLKSEGRVDIANKIKFARSFGDISENSEYDAAREEEAMMEQEISEIEKRLRNVQIITKAKVDPNKVGVGATVVVKDLEYNKELIFRIMGSLESKPASGQISNESPIGKALMGTKKGDEVEVSTPGATKMKLRVLNIRY